jgi:hypothetical protein
MTRVVTVLFALAVPAFAATPELIEEAEPAEQDSVEAQPCRPTIACMAEIVPAGYFEVEAGYGGTQGSSTFAHSGLLLLKYSLLDRVQLQLATNSLFLAGPGLVPRAFDGVMPGLKVVLNGQGRFMPSNALSAHVMIPTQAFEGAKQQTVDAQGWWYISKDVGLLHADVNLVLNVFDLTGAPIPQGLASLALSFALPKGFGLFTEVYSAFGNADRAPLDGGSLNGISFSPIDEVVFDVGGDIGFYPGTRAFTLFAGVTFVPHRKSAAPLVRAKPGANNAVALAPR